MTDVPLRDYVDTRFEALERAIITAKAESDRRLHGMNRFREEIDILTGKFITREDVEAKLCVLETRLMARIDLLEARIEHASAGKMPRGTAIMIAALCSLALSLIVYVVSNAG